MSSHCDIGACTLYFRLHCADHFELGPNGIIYKNYYLETIKNNRKNVNIHEDSVCLCVVSLQKQEAELRAKKARKSSMTTTSVL